MKLAACLANCVRVVFDYWTQRLSKAGLSERLVITTGRVVKLCNAYAAGYQHQPHAL